MCSTLWVHQLTIVGNSTRVFHTNEDDPHSILHVGLNTQHRRELSLQLGPVVSKEARLKGPLQHDDPFVLSIIREKFLHPPSTEPYDLETNTKYLSFQVRYRGRGRIKKL